MRTEAGLGEAELGKRIGRTRGAVWNYEHTDRRPDLNVIAAWARACGRRMVLDFPLADSAAGRISDEDRALLDRFARACAEVTDREEKEFAVHRLEEFAQRERERRTQAAEEREEESLTDILAQLPPERVRRIVEQLRSEIDDDRE